MGQAETPRLIGLIGLAGSGKSTAAQALQLEGYCRLRFAAPLKRMTAALLESAGLDPDDIEARIDGDNKLDMVPGLGCTSRRIMQTLGTEWGRRMIRDDLCLHLARVRIEYAWASSVPVCIDDCRFQNEADAIRSMGGVLVRITRPGVVAGGHVSEQEQATIPVDYELANDGTIPDLVDRVSEMMGKLKALKAA